MTAADLEGLDGILDLIRTRGPIFEGSVDDAVIRARLSDVLGILPPPTERAVETGETWSRDGIDGTELTWATGIGGSSTAWLLRPAGEIRPLPGVVALHCHGGVKRWGKEKIANGPDAVVPERIAQVRDELYGGRAFADDLARAGFAVLVPDAFGWGSRRIPIEAMPLRSEHVAGLELAAARSERVVHHDEEYDIHAGPHEDAMAKLLGVLGTSWGGLIAREDLLAVDCLADRSDVRPGGVGLIGLSGGGARAVLASALSDRIAATVVVAMMASMPHILDGHLHKHTWAMMNPGLGRVADWPEIAAARRPRALHVVFAEQDGLFPLDGMHAADRIIRDRYDGVGAARQYTGTFVPEPHSFDPSTQQLTTRWLQEQLAAAS